VSQHPVRLQRRITREIARGKYRGNLQPDDESGPDHGRNNLGNQAFRLRVDSGRLRRGRGHRAHRNDHTIGSKPSAASERRQNVDERRSQ
jgi:hypothetical protein